MGFGLLFIGYFISFLMSLNNYGFAFEIVGYAIMLSAIGKLSEYKHSLSGSSIALLVMALCSVYDGFRQVASLLSMQTPLFGINVSFSVSMTAAAATLMFHLLLLLPIRDIAREAQDNELSRKVYPAVCMATLACLLEFAVAVGGSFFVTDAPSTAFRTLTLISVLVHICYPLFSLVFIYSCYARLCPPEDKEMPQRPSRFAFVNKMRQKQEEKAAEVQRERQELLIKAEKKAEASAEKKKKK